MQTLWVRVADRREQAQDICAFDLVAVDESTVLTC